MRKKEMRIARSDFEGGCEMVRRMRDTCAGVRKENERGRGRRTRGGEKDEKENARLCLSWKNGDVRWWWWWRRGGSSHG